MRTVVLFTTSSTSYASSTSFTSCVTLQLGYYDLANSDNVLT